MTDEPFVPFLLVVVVPLAYLALRAGLFSTPTLRWAMGLLFAALVVLKIPWQGDSYLYLKRINLLVSGGVVSVLVLRNLRVAPLLAPRTYRLTLGILALGAVASYTNFFSFHGGRSYVHLHDVAHYYLGSKYFPELGYGSLYVAMVRAEAEEFGHAVTPEARDLTGNYLVPISRLLSASDAVKARFSPERWDSFRGDVRYFRERMGNAFGDVLKDHGYNPTPVWSLVGGSIANRVPAGSPAGILLLTLLDPLLLVIAFAAIGTVFGIESALLAVIYFSVAFGAMYTWKGGAFLRELSFTSIVASACLLEGRRHAAAGASLGLAAALRVFPGFLLAGILFHGAAEAWRTRRLPGAHARFATGFVLALLILAGTSALQPEGISRWREFAANTATHMQSASANLIGATGLLAYLRGGEIETAEGLDAMILWRRAVARLQLVTLFPVALLLVAWVSRRVELLRAMAIGAFLVLAGLNVSAYYYAFLVLLLLAFRDRPRDLALIFSVELVIYLVHLFEQHEVMLYLYKSLLLFFLLVALTLDEIRVPVRGRAQSAPFHGGARTS